MPQYCVCRYEEVMSYRPRHPPAAFFIAGEVQWCCAFLLQTKNLTILLSVSMKEHLCSLLFLLHALLFHLIPLQCINNLPLTAYLFRKSVRWSSRSKGNFSVFAVRMSVVYGVMASDLLLLAYQMIPLLWCCFATQQHRIYYPLTGQQAKFFSYKSL